MPPGVGEAKASVSHGAEPPGQTSVQERVWVITLWKLMNSTLDTKAWSSESHHHYNQVISRFARDYFFIGLPCQV